MFLYSSDTRIIINNRKLPIMSLQLPDGSEKHVGDSNIRAKFSHGSADHGMALELAMAALELVCRRRGDDFVIPSVEAHDRSLSFPSPVPSPATIHDTDTVGDVEGFVLDADNG